LPERYLVTGGAGFIGSHIVTRLVKDGHFVRVVDDLSSGKRENIEHIREAIEFVQCDIRNAAAVREATEGVDYVLHQAAVSSVAKSVADPVTSAAVNIAGTINVLVAARDAGVKRVVFASSAAVYGESEVSPKREDMQPDPVSPYAADKLAGEAYCRVFGRVYGLETVALRYFNVFGPRQDPQSDYAAAVPKFITTLLQGEAPTIFGDGEQSRDLVYVEDVVAANLLAAHAPAASGKVFNIAGGKSLTINEVVATLIQLIGIDVAPMYGPVRAGDVRHSAADISRARADIGYENVTGFEDGLRTTVAWYRASSAAAS
jgi:nucleoside-diphosphate-sugar epimerase